MARASVAELNAKMGLDVSPLVAGVAQAEGAFRRLKKAQAEGFGGPGIRAAAPQDLIDQVTRAQQLRARATMGGAEGPIAPDQNRIDAEVSYEMSKRVEAARQRVALEQQTAASIAAVRQQGSDADAAQAAQVEAQKQAALQRTATVQAGLRGYAIQQIVEEGEATRRSAASSAEVFRRMFAEREESNARLRQQADANAEAEMQTLQQIAALRAKQTQLRQTEAFDRANPFKQQVIATQQLNKLLAQRRGLQRGTLAFAQKELEVTQQIARVRSLRDSLTAGSAGFTRMGMTAADSMKSTARFGLAMQQTGYQVQDFAVQVASGTNALVALSQQGSQLLGFFGNYKGAIAGAVLSVGILAYRLLSTESAAKKLTETLKPLRQELRDIESERFMSFDVANRSLAEQIEFYERRNKAAAAGATFQQGRLDDVSKDPRGFFGEYLDALKSNAKAIVPVVVLTKTAAELATKYAIGATEAAIASKTQLSATQELVAAERDRLKTAREIAAAFEKQKTTREEVIRALDRSRVPLWDAEALSSAVETGALFQDQVQTFKDLKVVAREWQDAVLPDDVFARLDALRGALGRMTDLGLGKTDLFKEISSQLTADEKAIKQTADAYLDQLDPLRAKRRELETIAQLETRALLTAEQAAMLRLRMQDEINRSVRLPDAFKMVTGSGFAGGRNIGGDPNTLININKEMLRTLQRINVSLN